MTLEVGDKVLLRVPGLHGALEASWEGPYSVTEKLSRVNYKVCRDGSRNGKIVHINNTKVYKDRGKVVNSVCVVAEENKEMCMMWEGAGVLCDERCEGFSEGDLQMVLSGLSEFFSDCPGLCSIGSCRIEVRAGSEVVNLPPHQVPMQIKGAVDQEINRLLWAGIIKESSSEWCSPIVPVRKKDGTVRLCVDFRELNKVTPLRRYYLPSLTEILDRVGNARALSKLDLVSGFHQISMDEGSEDLTSFICPMGKFKFCRMPFGLKNAPAIFQSVLEEVLKPVSDVCSNYIDDVIVYSDSWSEHLTDLTRVIKRLGEVGLTIKRSKCEFGKRYMLYLGHQVGGGMLAVQHYTITQRLTQQLESCVHLRRPPDHPWSRERDCRS